MADLNSIIAATIDGKEITLKEILRRLKLAGKLGFVNDAIVDLLIARGAKAEGISVTNDELQDAVDNLRRKLQLFRSDDTHNWLKAQRMSAEDLEDQVELTLLKTKLIEKIVRPEQVESFFTENRRDYDRAHVAHIVVADENVANELKSQLVDEGADFAELAKNFSSHSETKDDGGDLDVVQRTTLSPGVESAVFSAKSGDVVGPIKSDMGFHIIKVYELLLGELTNGVAASIADRLFGEWLDGQMASGKVEVTLYNAI